MARDHAPRPGSRWRVRLPMGRDLPDDIWARRHTFNLFVLAIHVPALAAFALYQGYAPQQAFLAGGLVAAAGLVALPRRGSRSLRAGVASLGLLGCSAILAYLSGGFIEAHFHFFVIIPLIALYQRWLPFLLAFGFVVAFHGVLGTLAPTMVYNHPAAWAEPWRWAGLHGAFVAAASLTSLLHWRLNEESYAARATLAQQRLEGERRANAMRNQLLRTASHELKTPLTPLRLQVEMLKAGTMGPLTRAQQGAVAMLDRNLDRLSDLVTDVLDVARLQDGRLRLARQELDLRDAVREAAAVFRPLAAQRHVHLHLRTSGALPVRGDPNRLAQVLTNLLSNALKFTPSGGHVFVEAIPEGAEAVLRVRDSGIGMTPEQLQRLFVPFGQVHDTPTTTERGTGLGLFISRGIVQGHGGRILAESGGPGRGAMFTVRLPLLGASAMPPTTLPDGRPRRRLPPA